MKILFDETPCHSLKIKFLPAVLIPVNPCCVIGLSATWKIKSHSKPNLKGTKLLNLS